MIKAFLFDAAGTLIEPSEPVADTYARILSRHPGELDPARLATSFGSAFRRAGLPDYGATPDGDLAERRWWRSVVGATIGREAGETEFGAVFDHYSRASAWRVFPEVPAVLTSCTELGVRTAVVSNFDLRLHRILGEAELANRFDLVLTSAEARARKPSPTIFTEALRKLGLESHEALHVGDSAHADVGGARSVGIDAFLLDRPHNDLGDFIDWATSHREIG